MVMSIFAIAISTDMSDMKSSLRGPSLVKITQANFFRSTLKFLELFRTEFSKKIISQLITEKIFVVGKVQQILLNRRIKKNLNFFHNFNNFNHYKSVLMTNILEAH